MQCFSQIKRPSYWHVSIEKRWYEQLPPCLFSIWWASLVTTRADFRIGCDCRIGCSLPAISIISPPLSKIWNGQKSKHKKDIPVGEFIVTSNNDWANHTYAYTSLHIHTYIYIYPCISIPFPYELQSPKITGQVSPCQWTKSIRHLRRFSHLRIRQVRTL